MKYLIPILLLSFSGSVFAEKISIKCNFTSYSNPEGHIQLKENFTIDYFMDSITDKAVIVGNNGVADVIPIIKGGRLSFIEVTESGNISVTTIAQGKAVHSRNMFIMGDLFPSQYYGSCSNE